MNSLMRGTVSDGLFRHAQQVSADSKMCTAQSINLIKGKAMKFANGLYSVLAGAAILTAQAASAADAVEAQKTASYSLLPNAYGTIDVRHYDLRVNNADESKSKNPGVQSRLVVGSPFMNDKLDVSAIMAVTAKPATEKFKQRRPEINAKYTLVSGDLGEISPELQILTPHEGSATDAGPGLFAQLKAPDMDAGAFGKVFANVTGEWTTHLASRTADATVENESTKSASELGLVEQADGSTTRTDGKQDLDFNAEYMATVGTKIGAFGVTLAQFLDQNYDPRYTATDDGIQVSRPVKTSTTEMVKVSYKVSDKTTVSNENYFQQGGVFESTHIDYDANKGLPGFSNIAKVTYAF